MTHTKTLSKELSGNTTPDRTKYEGNIRAVEYHTNFPRMHEIHMGDLQISLLRLCKNWGITNPPDQDQLNAITNFLKNQFSDFTFEEIHHAFEMATAHKFDVNPEHYNHFNMPYVGRILGAYRDFRMMEIKRSKSQLTEEEESVKLTPEQHYNWVVKYVKEHRSVPFTADWGSVFTHMENVQQGPDNTQKQAFKKKMEGQLKQEGKMNLSGQDIKLGKEIFAILNTPSSLQSYCREQWVKQFMNQLIEK